MGVFLNPVFDVKSKMKNLKQKLPIILLLTLFTLGQSFVLLHSFSHQKYFSIAKEKQSFFQKIIFNHGDEKLVRPHHDCILLSFANLVNQILTADFSLIFASFYLIFARRYFDSLKLSFLLSSSFARAPPRFS